MSFLKRVFLLICNVLSLPDGEDLKNCLERKKQHSHIRSILLHLLWRGLGRGWRFAGGIPI